MHKPTLSTLATLLLAASPLAGGCSSSPKSHPDAKTDAKTDTLPADMCSTSFTGGIDAGQMDAAAGTVAIPIIPAGTQVSGVSGQSNFQSVTMTATLPPGAYSSIKVRYHIKTDCTGNPPAGQNWPAGCDPFDRLTYLNLEGGGADAGAGIPLRLIDAVTPFGGESTYVQDVTDYYPMLVGTHSYKVDITTYADPSGMASGSSAAFAVDATLLVVAGTPAHTILGVFPIFDGRITPAPMTDGGAPLPPVMASLTAPVGATSAYLNLYSTGHGAVGSNVCDEFCMKTNTITVDGSMVFNQAPWTDCSNNCTHLMLPFCQSFSCGSGSFNYICQQNPTSCPSSATFPRAGWCPSQIVRRQTIALPSADATGTHAVTMAIQNVQGYFVASLAAVFYR